MRTLITVSRSELKKMIFNPASLLKLERISHIDWVEAGKSYGISQLSSDIAGYDACITSWGSPRFSAEVLSHADKLKFIGHAGGSVFHIVDPSAFDRGITVVNANSALAYSTAEACLALMMAGAWKFQEYGMRMKRGQWPSSESETVMGLYKQRVGVIGLGEISREVIHLLKMFDAEILVCSSHCSKEEAETLGVELTGLEHLLRTSRIISVHNSLIPSTEGMITRRHLDMIADGALLVNTARGPIIEEQALIDTLKQGRFHAALDVYHREPVEQSYPLLDLPNVLCLPHIGGFSAYWKTRIGELVADDLERWASGQPLLGEVSLEKYNLMTIT